MEIVNYIPSFLLIFMRMLGLFILSPVFGRRNVPTYVKIGMSLAMALILLNILSLQSLEVWNNIWLYAWLLFKELIVGIIVGYITTLAFSAIMIAGQIMDFQIGFGMINAFDPMNEISVPIVGNLINLVALLLFFGLNGHHVLITLLFESYKVLPIGRLSITPDILWYIVSIFTDAFIWGIKLSIPFIGILLLNEILLGVLSRAIPQMNIFILGMPIRLIIGLIMLVLLVPIYMELLGPLFDQMFYYIDGFMQRMIG